MTIQGWIALVITIATIYALIRRYETRLVLLTSGFLMCIIALNPSTMLESAHSAAHVKVLPSPAPVLDRAVYIEGREDYFTRDAELLRAVCEEELEKEIAPRLRAIVPWAAERIVVGAEPSE